MSRRCTAGPPRRGTGVDGSAIRGHPRLPATARGTPDEGRSSAGGRGRVCRGAPRQPHARRGEEFPHPVLWPPSTGPAESRHRFGAAVALGVCQSVGRVGPGLDNATAEASMTRPTPPAPIGQLCGRAAIKTGIPEPSDQIRHGNGAARAAAAASLRRRDFSDGRSYTGGSRLRAAW